MTSGRPVPWMAVRVSVTAAAIAVVSFFAPVGWLLTVGTDVIIPAAFWSAAAFIVYYSLLAPWWRNPVGHMIVFLDFAIVCALLGDILHLEFGVHLSAAVLMRCAIGGLLIVPVVVLSRMILLGRLNGWKPKLPWRHPKRLKE